MDIPDNARVYVCPMLCGYGPLRGFYTDMGVESRRCILSAYDCVRGGGRKCMSKRRGKEGRQCAGETKRGESAVAKAKALMISGHTDYK